MTAAITAHSLQPDPPKRSCKMPKVSRETAEVAEFGPVEDRHDEIDGYSVNFVSFRQDADAAPLLKGLPDDRCPCPHWGYVFKGRMTFDFGDHEEVFDAGDAFYVPAGHVPKVEAGTEIVQFSPAADLHPVEAAMVENMKRLARA
jgi:mannose-6-phosphate isomerase-like protein (cupin superfamily)